MTAAQTAYMKATGGESSNTPAEVGKLIIEGVFGREVPEERMDALNDAMHWLYGTGWGVVYRIVLGGRRRRPARAGLAFGAAVWAVSLVELPALGVAPPPWEYSPADVVPDLGFHLAYGLGVATAFELVSAG